MKRQVLFVQGGGAGAHDEWDNKLVDSLRSALGRNYDVRYPRMPSEEDPNFEAWKGALREEFARLEDGAILIGHSVGGTVLINAVAEQRPKFSIGAIVLIAAPFVGNGGWEIDDWQPQRDVGEKLPNGVPVYLYHGLQDTTAPPEHAELYARMIPQAELRLLPGRDHQLNDDLSEVAATISALTMSANR